MVSLYNMHLFPYFPPSIYNSITTLFSCSLCITYNLEFGIWNFREIAEKIEQKKMVAPTRRSLELIPNDSARKMAFRKRKKNVYKKADELSKLCDIDVALIVYEADQNKDIRPIQPETWPQDPVEFNRILDRYKASRDTAAPGFSKRNFDLSDFYEARKKKDEKDEKDDNNGDNDDNDDGDDSDDDDDAHVDPELHKPGNKQISEDKYPTWDPRIDQFSQDELTILIASLEAKIQASTLRIDSMDRYTLYAEKQNRNLSRPESSSSKTPHHLKPANFDVQKPDDVHKHPSQNPINTTTTTTTSTSATQSKPPASVKCPMLPSAWISISESQKTPLRTSSSGG